MPRRRGRAATAIAVVFACVAAVALASRGAPTDRTAAAWETASASRTILYAGIGVAIGLCLGLAIWALWPGGEPSLKPPARMRLVPYLIVAVLLAGMAVAASRRDPADDPVRERSQIVDEPPAADQEGGRSTFARRASPAGSLAVAGAALATLALYAAKTRRRADGEEDPGATDDEDGVVALVEPALADDILGGSLDAAIAAVDAEPDPRRAVLLAYAVLEVHLSATPAARPPTATPQEWLRRIRAAYRHQPPVAAAASELTARYERARFGGGAPDRRDRDAVVAALRDLASSTTTTAAAGPRS